MTGILLKVDKREMWTKTGRMPYEHEGRDQSDAFTNQKPKTVSTPSEVRREAWNTSSLRVTERTS